MIINVKEKMTDFILNNGLDNHYQFSDVNIETDFIKGIMINEVVPNDPQDDFYGKNEIPSYLTTTIPLFSKAGFEAKSIDDITKAGIYITNAVKYPKTSSTIEKDKIEACASMLEYEIELFPNVKVIMLMGDVAKKAFNYITKAKTKKNAVPAISTYKLRNSELYYKNIRIFPSYIMTGGNILIEKSKVSMAAEDIRKMLQIIR